MAKRFKMSKRASKRTFSKSGSRTHRRNVPQMRTVMRGGIRL